MRWQIAQQHERRYWEQWKLGEPEKRKEIIRRYWNWYLDTVSKRVTLQGRVLEIGCGPDGIINYIEADERHGLDPLMDFYMSNFTLSSEVMWEKGVGEDLPFPDGHFDSIVTTNNLDHVREPKSVLAEIHRCLKKGGHLILTVDCYSFLYKMARLASQKAGIGDALHPFSFSVRDVQELLRISGFNILDVHRGIGNLGAYTRRELGSPPIRVGARKPAKTDFLFIASK